MVIGQGGGSEQRSDSGCILKVESGTICRYEGKTEVRGDSKEFGLSNHKNGKSCYYRRQKEYKFQFGHVGLEMPISHVSENVTIYGIYDSKIDDWVWIGDINLGAFLAQLVFKDMMLVEISKAVTDWEDKGFKDWAVGISVFGD